MKNQPIGKIPLDGFNLCLSLTISSKEQLLILHGNGAGNGKSQPSQGSNSEQKQGKATSF